MMTIKVYRGLLALALLLGIAGIIASAFTSSLPAELRDYRATTEEVISLWHAVVGLTVLVVSIVCLVGLWRLRRWARSLFLFFLLASLAILPLLGPFVETGWTYTLYAAENVVSGIILAASYWSSLSDQFGNSAAA